jgi:hypothetical protein
LRRKEACENVDAADLLVAGSVGLSVGLGHCYASIVSQAVMHGDMEWKAGDEKTPDEWSSAAGCCDAARLDTNRTHVASEVPPKAALRAIHSPPTRRAAWQLATPADILPRRLPIGGRSADWEPRCTSAHSDRAR